MWPVLILVGAVACALASLLARRLLTSALWLAGTSALVAVVIYLLGAPEIAVIELSVGAGLVTVLLVFAINIAGEEAIPVMPFIPRPVSWGLVLVSAALLAWMSFPALQQSIPESQMTPFSEAVWRERGLDALLQVVLIFTGVLGVLSLLSETHAPVIEVPEAEG